jgi:hypothetical protein
MTIWLAQLTALPNVAAPHDARLLRRRAANLNDPILRLVPEGRRDTLAPEHPARRGTWHINIPLSGERETIFFDV